MDYVCFSLYTYFAIVWGQNLTQTLQDVRSFKKKLIDWLINKIYNIYIYNRYLYKGSLYIYINVYGTFPLRKKNVYVFVGEYTILSCHPSINLWCFGVENTKIIKCWWWSDDNSLLLFVWTKEHHPMSTTGTVRVAPG